MALKTNLVSYWKLEEASGNAVDAHGSNTLTDNNTVGTASGKIGNARDFEASSSQFFKLTSDSTLDSNGVDFGCACWVNPESLSGFSMILSRMPAGGGYELRLNGDGTAFQFNLADAVTVNSGTPTTGNWFLIIIWRSVADGKIYISVNNAAAAEAAYVTDPIAGAADFGLGARPASSLHWDGLIDEVAIRIGSFWTADERTEIYNGGAGLGYDSWDATGQPTTKRLGGVKFDSQRVGMIGMARW